MFHPSFRHLVPVTLLGLVACSSSYHPEYHPVTVSNFSQNVSYPVSVGGAVERPAAAVTPPTPVQPSVVIVPAIAAPEGPPPDFFR